MKIKVESNIYKLSYKDKEVFVLTDSIENPSRYFKGKVTNDKITVEKMVLTNKISYAIELSLSTILSELIEDKKIILKEDKGEGVEKRQRYSDRKGLPKANVSLNKSIKDIVKK